MRKWILFIILISLAPALKASDAIYKNVLNALMANDTALINKSLNSVSVLPLSEKKACTGALLMKKAGLATIPAEKLRLFKQGRHILEGEIKSHPDKVLFHFLRLIIQENSPPFLGYNKNMKEDAALLRKHYKSLSTDVRQAVSDYAKHSKILTSSDFE